MKARQNRGTFSLAKFAGNNSRYRPLGSPYRHAQSAVSRAHLWRWRSWAAERLSVVAPMSPSAAPRARGSGKSPVGTPALQKAQRRPALQNAHASFRSGQAPPVSATISLSYRIELVATVSASGLFGLAGEVFRLMFIHLCCFALVAAEIAPGAEDQLALKGLYKGRCHFVSPFRACYLTIDCLGMIGNYWPSGAAVILPTNTPLELRAT
jgi:hypothetical protein